MNRKSQPSMTKPIAPSGRRKVKSGCRTCRDRKVKCDERFPACQRCLSTGRTCDGYGIWGGGGALSTRPGLPQGLAEAERACSLDIGPFYSPYSHHPILLDMGDRARFDWFRQRSAPKLPGTFTSGFWSKLIFQAASTEPSVLHAILALGTVHRRTALSQETARAQEVVTLRHYTKSIRHLQRHLTAANRASLHVSLTTCLLFICLELLRGHFITAQRHMENGLKVFSEAEVTLSDGGMDVPGMYQPRAKMLDGWILETFSRLRLQFRLFHQHRCEPCFDTPLSRSLARPTSPQFHTINEAWQYLASLLNEAMDISHQFRRRETGATSLAILHQRRQRNHANISHWNEMYRTSVDRISMQTPRENERQKLYFLLLQYALMAEIMTAACTAPDESVYDSHTSKFIAIISNGIALLRTAPGSTPVEGSSDYMNYRGLSIIDMGWLPPLYYAATKCRVHRIRLQAVRLLASSQHQEGIWDSKVTQSVAQKVVALEERDFYHGILDRGDDFSVMDCPAEEDLSLPVLPEHYRMRTVETSFEGEPLDRVRLECRQMWRDTVHTVLVWEYNVASQKWESKMEEKSS